MTVTRVLHVVGMMHRGGVETWLMHLLRNSNPSRLQMDFLVNRSQRGDYDEEIRARGSRLLECVNPRRPYQFGRTFLDLVAKHGPYSAVHSHIHHYSGFVLALARCAGIPIRIAHSHTSQVDGRKGLFRNAYLRAMQSGISRCATRGFAVSDVAGAALFGPEWRSDSRWSILRCGLDFSAFRAPVGEDEVRREFGIAPGAPLLVHVGRFDPQKNHKFLLRIAAAMLRREPQARFVLVGEGPLRRSLQARAEEQGLAERLVFAGVRSDVPRILRAADVFILPSISEGLPLVGLEAQAAGVPIVVSDTVTRELEVIPELFFRRSLEQAPDQWCDAICVALRRGRVPPGLAVTAMERSEFGVAQAVRALELEYGIE